jgi:hypothetical protein
MLIYQAADPHVQDIIDSGFTEKAAWSLSWAAFSAIIVYAGDIRDTNSSDKVYTPRGIPGPNRSSRKPPDQEYDPNTRY